MIGRVINAWLPFEQLPNGGSNPLELLLNSGILLAQDFKRDRDIQKE